jgi:hypothetical protein
MWFSWHQYSLLNWRSAFFSFFLHDYYEHGWAFALRKRHIHRVARMSLGLGGIPWNMIYMTKEPVHMYSMNVKWHDPKCNVVRRKRILYI